MPSRTATQYVGDPAFVDVPTETLLSQEFADARACVIDPDAASVKPVAPAALDAAGCALVPAAEAPDTENLSTTHLSVVDRWGNAVAYTLTIEQTGGSGMIVPGRGFLLNNELTDFNFAPASATVPDPNLVEPGKRPRSSMSPTIVLDGGDVRYVVGSPGGSMIITTVTQVLMNRIDLGMTLPEAVAAPRASQRNTAVGGGGAGVPHRVRSAAHAVRALVHDDGRDRRGGRHRGRSERPDDGRRGAGATGRWHGPGGEAGALTEVARRVSEATPGSRHPIQFCGKLPTPPM